MDASTKAAMASLMTSLESARFVIACLERDGEVQADSFSLSPAELLARIDMATEAYEMAIDTTDAKAKEKWCPFVRVSGDGDEWHTNRPSYAEVSDKQFDRCLGPACMAWRWTPLKCGKEHAEAVAKPMRDRPTTGFCGLAGTPAD